MKRFFSTQAAFLAVFSLVSAASAQITLIDFGAVDSIGNGSFFSDPAGEVAPAPTVTGPSDFQANTVVNTNGIGRALVGFGGSPGDSFATLTDDESLGNVLDNHGVSISGWSVHRTFYTGANNAFGFLEDNFLLDGVGSAANDGSVFTNSSSVTVVSEAIALDGNSMDLFTLSVVAGSDTATGSSDLSGFLIFDDGLETETIVQIGSSVSISGEPTVDGTATGEVERTVFSGLSTTGFSTVRAGFDIAGPTGFRTILDDVQFIVDPGPVDTTLGDFNADGLVDAADFTTFRDNAGGTDETLINEAGVNDFLIDGADFNVFVDNFDPSVGAVAPAAAAASAVPEPATLLTLFAGALIGSAGRRRR